MGPLPDKFKREYDEAAEHYVKHGEIPHLMPSPGAYDWIQADPEAFFERIKQFRYAAELNRIAAELERNLRLPGTIHKED